MDRFVRVLGQTELDPTRTNDLKEVEFFRILENFKLETLFPDTTNLTKRQLRQFIFQFEKYLGSKPSVDEDEQDEHAHLVRRLQFEKKAEKEEWVKKLKEKYTEVAFGP